MALIISTNIYPSGGRMGITHFIHSNYGKKGVRLFHLNNEEENPYEPYSFLNQSVYYDSNVKSIALDSMNLPDNLRSDSINLIVARGKYAKKLLHNSHLRLLKRGHSSWAVNLTEWYFNYTDEYFLFIYS